MDKVPSFQAKVTIMKDSGNKIQLLGLVSINGKMVGHIKDNGWTIKCMELAIISRKMEGFM